MHYLIKEWKTTGNMKEYLPLKAPCIFFLNILSLLIYICAGNCILFAAA